MKSLSGGFWLALLMTIAGSVSLYKYISTGNVRYKELVITGVPALMICLTFTIAGGYGLIAWVKSNRK